MSSSEAVSNGGHGQSIVQARSDSLLQRAISAGGTVHFDSWIRFRVAQAVLRRRFGRRDGTVTNSDGSRTHQINVPHGTGMLSFEYTTQPGRTAKAEG